MSLPLLQVDDLTVAFGAMEAISGVTLRVEAGRCLGIVGESGSGKSVTSLAILRLIPEPAGRIVSGRILFEGTDLLGLPRSRMPAIRGRDIAMVFQEPMSSLNPLMTIGDQIGEALYLHEKLTRRDRSARVIDALRSVGIPAPEERVGAYPHQFSGGMRQRVMIAMALACNPKLLIADEPTTALDVTIQAQVLALIRRLRERLNTAVILISHDLGVIAELADEVAVMYAGSVIETGAVRDVLRTPGHPYTRALLQSIPRLRDDRRRLFQIPGTVPSSLARPAGCHYAARCADRRSICAQQMPPMLDLNPAHRAACWVAGGAVP